MKADNRSEVKINFFFFQFSFTFPFHVLAIFISVVFWFVLFCQTVKKMTNSGGSSQFIPV